MQARELKKDPSSFAADPRLSAVLSGIGDIYYILDYDWRFVAFNAPTAAFFQTPRDELLGRTLWEMYPPGAGSPFTPVLRRAMEEGEPAHLRAPSLIQIGRIFDIRAVPIEGVGIGVSVVDMTERAQAEETIRESRERLDLAVAAHRIGIFDWHVPSGRIVWSRELEEIFGLEPGAFEGTQEAFAKRVVAEDFERALAETNERLARGDPLIPFHFRILRADGATRWVEGTSRVVYGADGSPERIVGTNFDVTERVLAEQAMRESRERLDLAVEAHTIGIFDWRLPSGRIVWSPELEHIFGLETGAFGGTVDDFNRFVVPEDAERSLARMQAALAARQEVIHFDFRIRRPDGVLRWVEGVARLIWAPDGTPERMVGTNIDVTERKMAELHQRLLVNELNHRVKNTLAIVQSIAWQSFRSGGMALPAREAFEGRISALASAHDVLTRRDWAAGSIAQMVSGAVAPYDPGGGRLTTCGPEVNLEAKTAVALALAMHELATNAVKHGALSTADGHVDVRWTTEAGRLRLVWRESGGPPVAPPVRPGFGTRLLERGLAEELHGCVRLEFLPGGLVCTVDAPLESAVGSPTGQDQFGIEMSSGSLAREGAGRSLADEETH